MTSALNLSRSAPSHFRSSLPVRQQRRRDSLFFLSSSSSTFSMDLSRSASTILGESVDTRSSVAYSSDSFTDSAEDRELECVNSLDSAIEKQGIRIRRRPPTGPPTHAVGPFEFRLENEGNTPRNILEKIIWNKDTEISQLKERKPLAVLGREVNNAPPVRDFVGALKASYQRTGMPALIAEVKKASPSRGVLREDFDPIQIANAYETNGAACLSVLTDEKYFQGSFENLEAIRRAGVKCPLLCKEFIIDAWQLYYARSKGADAVLLIAAVLPDLDIKYMTKICSKLGLAVLVEVHDEREMDRVLGIDGIQLIGINNRNLETFEVDISNTKRLLEGDRGEIIRQKGILVVGESGLFTPEDISYVQEAGVKAVLVGESLIKQEDPGRGIARLFDLNVIDRCWRNKPNWDKSRTDLAMCAVGFSGKMKQFRRTSVVHYEVTDPSDDPENPREGTLRYGATMIGKRTWITFKRDMKIKLDLPIFISNRTAIDGRGAEVHIYGAGFVVFKTKNIIIHGLHFHDIFSMVAGNVFVPGNDRAIPISAQDPDAIQVVTGHKVWIDHNTFRAAGDGLIDVIDASTRITISNNRFMNHDKVILLGHNNTHVVDRAMRVTVLYNHFGPDCHQRMPRIRFGYVHVANNLYEGWDKYAIGGCMNPTILSQGNRFIAPEGRGHQGVAWLEEGSTWVVKSEDDSLENGAFFTIHPSDVGVIPRYGPKQKFKVRRNEDVMLLTKDAGALNCHAGELC